MNVRDDPRECPREGCDVERFSSIGMDFHIHKEHGIKYLNE